MWCIRNLVSSFSGSFPVRGPGTGLFGSMLAEASIVRGECNLRCTSGPTITAGWCKRRWGMQIILGDE